MTYPVWPNTMHVIDAVNPSVIGREPELERLSSLAADARNGHGASLLIRGEPGIGKTTLLGEISRAAQGTTVLRADGYEVESEMPYATLQRIGRPLVAYLDALLPTHSTALRIASGIEEGPPPDRYLVGMGMLSLLAAAGDDAPLACLVDDAHLVDTESLEVLAFVARRLEAERVLLVLATRPDARTDRVAAGVPVLDLGGLDPLSSVTLLNGTAPTPLDPLLATRIAEQADGNPLALVELARALSSSRLTASWVAEEPVPVGSRLEAHYLQQITSLPEDSRRWLLLAAAESTGDLELIDAAAARLGLAADASAPVESAGLASIRDSVAFRHALVRSVVYNAVPDSDRRRAHAALRDEAGARGGPRFLLWARRPGTGGPPPPPTFLPPAM